MPSKARQPLSGEEKAALKKIRELIESRGWSLGQMARTIHIDPAAMSRLFQEQRGMDFFEFVRIAQALGKAPKELMGELDFTVPPRSEDEVIVDRVNESLTEEQFKLLEKRRKKRKNRP